ncbi:G patch domain-containing protein 1-like [Babylonia areolata]|uniref:G patch domain-containing protein 1-like n=1 Tax=Babylonia areolata TaxID=304850 RepID=UPI003FD419B9
MAVSSDSEDESFVELGNPLPFVEGEGKKKPILLQDAPCRSDKEARGRPRFHGAFTGGFSAGYFNSVGSKEGWTPSTFASSRQQKQDLTFQQPEDFMDDEDLGEHGIAPRQFATSDAFSSDAQKRKRKAEVMSSTRDSILPASAALTDLIVPERLPIGIRLLRKMGWKEGQGIGPRVKIKKKKKKKQNTAPGVKIYGCSLPPRSDEDDESDLSDLDLQNVTFAPKDVTPVSLTSKDNVHGLGYRGLDPRSALPATHISLFDSPAVRSSKSRKGIRGQAFGVGALEDEDEDIYATDSLSSYDQTMELDDSQQFFGWTAPGARRGQGKQEQPKVPVSYVGKLLEGFTLSAKPLPPKKVFPPPTLPRGFQPFHKFKKTAEQLAQEAIGETPVSARPSQGQQKLNAVERGLMLDEKPIATSVFDLIPKEDVRKMEAVKEAAKMAASRFQSAGTTSENNNSSSNSSSSGATLPTPTTGQAPRQEVAAAALGSAGEKVDQSAAGVGVRPFHKDPGKQARYDRYLVLVKQGVKEPYEEVAAGHLTEWERQREKEEFSKAAMIYRPLSNMMASRFTRGTFIDDAQQQTLGLVEAVTEKSEQAKAAEMKMYGRLTRDEMEWHPHNVLCKRFNIPNPYPDSDIVGVPGLKRDKFSVFNFLSVPTQPASTTRDADTRREAPKARGVTNSLTRELNASKRKKGALSIFSVLEEEEKTPRKSLPILSMSENDEEEKAAAEEDGSDEKADEDHMDSDDGRPKDLFRAIFKNSDSESSSASSEKSDSEKSDDEDDRDVPADSEEKKKDEDVLPSVKDSSLLDDKGLTSGQPSRQLPPPPTPTRADPLSPSSPTGPPPPLPPQPSTTTTTSTAQPRVRKASRWGVGSIFDVLDQSSPPRSSPSSHLETGGGDVGSKGEERLSSTVPERVSAEDMGMYGPSLPPVGSMGTSSASRAVSVSSDAHRKHKHKHREQDRDSSKHRHKKEKKKKSKHKKEKKKKKKSKHSHHRKHCSSSDADSDTDSDT